jgi:hypothetical protein
MRDVALKLIADAVVDSVREAGPLGAPAGPLYAAIMTYGMAALPVRRAHGRAGRRRQAQEVGPPLLRGAAVTAPPRYPHAVGSRVAGVDARGQAFNGVVTATPGPYSVTLDGRLTVPITMISPPIPGDST